MNNYTKNSLIEGSVAKGMVLFAIPIFLSNLFQQLYNAADTLIVGKLINEQALAAVGSSASLIFLLTGFVNGMSMGAGVVIARHFGSGNKDRLKKAIHNTVILGLALGAFLTAAGVLLTPIILKAMGTPADVIENSIIYFRIYFMGCISVVMYNCGSSILQSVGDSRHPMIYLISASILNVILDLFFIGVLKTGVGGAALATIISQTFSASLAFIKLFKEGKKGSPYGVRLNDFNNDFSELRGIVNQGIPSGLQNSMISIANVIVQANINSFGSVAMAGCASYSKIEGFAFLPVTCFSLSLATYVSQNLGAKQYDRVRNGIMFGSISSLVLSEIIGLSMVKFSPFIIGLFSNDPSVIAYGVRECHVQPFFYFMLAFSHCAAGSLRGFGRPVVPMTIMLLVWCLLRITYITLTLSFINKIEVIFWAYPITWTISSVLFFFYLKNLLKSCKES